jgi:hypothetical protein
MAMPINEVSPTTTSISPSPSNPSLTPTTASPPTDDKENNNNKNHHHLQQLKQSLLENNLHLTNGNVTPANHNENQLADVSEQNQVYSLQQQPQQVPLQQQQQQQQSQQSEQSSQQQQHLLSLSSSLRNGEVNRVQFLNSTTTTTSTGTSARLSMAPVNPSASGKRAATVTAGSLKRTSTGTLNTGTVMMIPPSVGKQDSEHHIQKLSLLKDLLDQGYLAPEEYNERKSQIIDQITGTGSNTSGAKRSSRPGKNQNLTSPHLTSPHLTSPHLLTRSHSHSHSLTPPLFFGFISVLQPEAVPHRPPPDFSKLPTERAVKHTFDPLTQSWLETSVKVKIDDKPFAKGGLRYAYYMVVDSDSRIETVVDPVQDEKDKIYVAKISIDPEEDRDSYFQDVEIQMYSKEWAKKFNSYNPPKKVEFLKAYVLELVDRQAKPMYVTFSSSCFFFFFQLCFSTLLFLYFNISVLCTLFLCFVFSFFFFQLWSREIH